MHRHSWSWGDLHTQVGLGRAAKIGAGGRGGDEQTLRTQRGAEFRIQTVQQESLQGAPVPTAVEFRRMLGGSWRG